MMNNTTALTASIFSGLRFLIFHLRQLVRGAENIGSRVLRFSIVVGVSKIFTNSFNFARICKLQMFSYFYSLYALCQADLASRINILLLD